MSHPPPRLRKTVERAARLMEEQLPYIPARRESAPKAGPAPLQVGLRIRRPADGVGLSAMLEQSAAPLRSAVGRPVVEGPRALRRQLSATPVFATPQRLHSTLGPQARASPAAVSMRSSDDAVAALAEAIGEQTRQNQEL